MYLLKAYSIVYNSLKTRKFPINLCPKAISEWAEAPKNITSCRYQRWRPSWSLPSVRWWIVTKTSGLGETPVVERQPWWDLCETTSITWPWKLKWHEQTPQELDELNIPEDNISKFKLYKPFFRDLAVRRGVLRAICMWEWRKWLFGTDLFSEPRFPNNLAGISG